ncbi:sensor histidine kinase [Plantactinospora soyae]|uniref:histidine kinase n=1 Tax=Plantactinospora soyae TaxID=1544732 RepID=A0A927QXH0_9ACTN|nr:histidine kinase [Plantactinospora soyae]MBE1488040.1 signal transduction histidine kinase [Plantactinospora soyae]
MRLVRDWLLPVVLAGAQLAYWPGSRLGGGGPVDPELVAGLVATVGCAVALGWRRHAPVLALGAVLLAQALGRLAVDPDALLVVVSADVIALYSVAVRRPLRIAGPAVAVAFAQTAVLGLLVYGFGATYLGEVLLGLAVYPVTLGLGRSRRRWHAARTAAAQRLAEAEADRQRAASTERHRLARELHDVSAHHLTAIVVTAGAALRLADRRPELVAEAVGFSARTGRETLTALHRLVAVIRSAEQQDRRPLEVRLAELADGFRRLGQPVRVEPDPIPVEQPELPPAVAEAVYGIAREALTNALRHAPGSAVRLRIARHPASVQIVVGDEGGGVPGKAAELGSGRGVPGMRDRAASLGGTLTAGPEATGWRVRATLPLAAPVGSAGRPGWRRPSWARVVDALVVLGVLALTVAPVLPVDGSAGAGSGSAGLLVGLVMAAHAVPLLWRRRRPWAALSGVLGSAALWPVAVVGVPLPGESAEVLVAGAICEFVVVYAVAGYARPAPNTLLAIPVTALSLAAALTASAAVDGSMAGQPVRPDAPMTEELGLLVTLLYVLPGWLAMAGVLTVPLGAVWLLGAALRRRRTGVLAREADAVARTAASAVEAARWERARIAAGLRAAVLDRAGQVVAAADEGRLDVVVERARSTLTAMRGLLDTLRADAGAERRAPQPTVGAIARLCADQRAAGRLVEASVPVAPGPLPADVDVSAYRVVELALAAGDPGPIAVDLRYGDGGLRIVVAGAPSATDPVIVAGLRARVGALGGEVAVDVPAGRLDVWLPTPVPAPPGRVGSGRRPVGSGRLSIGDEEVATSSSG